MKIVTFLQNQWVRDPARLKRLITNPRERELYNRFLLFRGCHTGRVLQQCWGEELCDHVIWENASPEIGNKASAKFPPDLAHMKDVLDWHQPGIVVGLSAPVHPILWQWRDAGAPWVVFVGPHPANRRATTRQDLIDLGDAIKELLI